MESARTGWLQPDELDIAEHRAQYATDEVEIHGLARQTLLRLVEEVRWRRQQAIRSDAASTAPSPPPANGGNVQTGRNDR